MASNSEHFSAGEQALGYSYQIRHALLSMFSLPESTTCCIEGDDDVDYDDPEEGRLLASLKHKATGDTLTDLSPDFWKSVRIWATRYSEKKEPDAKMSFFLFTTGQVSTGSFLENFLPGRRREKAREDIVAEAIEILAKTRSKTILKTKHLLDAMSDAEKADFFSKVLIFDCQERINRIPEKIMDLMRAVRTQFRQAVYQRLEGWWTNECIKLLTGERDFPLYGREMFDKLAQISEQFYEDNLPLDFYTAEPKQGVNPDADNRLFVRQLREIGVGSSRITRAILDYYRAFEQRSSWARENVTHTGEVEVYDDRLVDEWERHREIICEDLAEDSSEEILKEVGKRVLNALSTSDSEHLRIRPRVSAPYVTMGSYHMLANEPAPRVYWHPKFLERIAVILEGGDA